MNARGHTSTPLLLLILLAVLIQPIVLLLIRDGGGRDDVSIPPRDAGMETAIRELTEALTRRKGGSASQPPTMVPDPRLETVLSRLTERLDAAPVATVLSQPSPRGNLPPRDDYPRQQDRIDAWLKHWREQEERDVDPPPNLFFHRSKAEVLASFGVPDDSYDGGIGAMWTYRSPDHEGEMRICFDGDRAFRFFFD